MREPGFSESISSVQQRISGFTKDCPSLPIVVQSIYSRLSSSLRKTMPSSGLRFYEVDRSPRSTDPHCTSDGRRKQAHGDAFASRTNTTFYFRFIARTKGSGQQANNPL